MRDRPSTPLVTSSASLQSFDVYLLARDFLFYYSIQPGITIIRQWDTHIRLFIQTFTIIVSFLSN